MTTRKVYTEELEELSVKVARMGNQLEEMISHMVNALVEMDAKGAEEIIKQDDVIDEMEREIERSCISIIAKQQPVATDLRRVTSIMRLISDVERIADHCGDISEYIIALANAEPIPMPKHVLDMIHAMGRMVTETIESFITEDIEEIDRIVAGDDEIDAYFAKIKEELCEAMKKDPAHIESYVDYLLIVKYVERMADHATNIAEWIAFIITGDLEQYMNS